MIFHGFRRSKDGDVLVFSPHYHSLSFITKGGFDRCRECVHGREDCYSCDGFKGRESRGYKKDGYLVKVEAERETIFGTAFYLLHHSTIRIGLKGFHVTTWWGCCSSKNFKAEKVEVEVVCPVCAEDMVKSMYMGMQRIVKDIGSPEYVAVFVYDVLGLSGEPNYVPVR